MQWLFKDMFRYALVLALLLPLTGCSKKKSAGAGPQGGDQEKPREAAEGHSEPGDADSTRSPWKAPSQYADLVVDYRKSWAKLSGLEFSGLHWRQKVVIYVNKEPERYVKNYLEYVRLYVNQDIDDAPEEEEEGQEERRFEPYSPGTVFLKENYLAPDSAPGKALTITAMIKREKGYDAKSNDWQFLQWDTEGHILFDGNTGDAPTSAMCIKCHANMAERDFVFSTFCSRVPLKE